MIESKLFITGSESFVGKAVIDYCNKKSYKYLAIDLNAENSLNTKKFDIRNKNIYKIIPKNSIIIHLAAISNNLDFDKDPVKGMEVNLDGTINLFLNAKKKKCKKFIFASTEWVYGDQSLPFPMNEESSIDIQKIKSKYALSKILTEIYLKSINFTNLVFLRFGIIYSSHRSGGSAVESIFSNLIKNNHIHIGSKSTARRFIHLDDIVEGIFKAVRFKQKEKVNLNIFNLTGNELITLNKIIKLSSILIKKKFIISETSAKNASIRNIVNTKAKKILKWKPKSKMIQDLNKLKNFLSKLK
jgi:nucleoside-diphosphate-sugar epimerase